MPNERASAARRGLASAISVAVALAVLQMMLDDRGESVRSRDWAILGMVVAPFVGAAGLIWSRRLWAQLLARACWWSVLLIGTFMLSTTGGPERAQPTLGVLGCAVSLLAVGRSGLDHSSGSFRPVAFRGTLLLSLMLAMADSVFLGLFSAGTLVDGLREPRTLMMLALFVVTCTGVVGLMRLRTWGLFVALAVNILIGVLAVTGALPVGSFLQKLFMGTALLQLVVPLPMVVTIVRRRAPGPDRWQRARAVGAPFVIVALAAVSAYAGFGHRGAPLISISSRPGG